MPCPCKHIFNFVVYVHLFRCMLFGSNHSGRIQSERTRVYHSWLVRMMNLCLSHKIRVFSVGASTMHTNIPLQVHRQFCGLCSLVLANRFNPMNAFTVRLYYKCILILPSPHLVHVVLTESSPTTEEEEQVAVASGVFAEVLATVTILCACMHF